MERNEFRFGDTISSAFHLTCDRETHFLLPELQTFTKTIPGFDGYVDFGIGGYGPRTISADIYYDGDYAVLRENREAIIAWLYSDHGAYKQLEFGDEPGKYYMAKITGELNFTNTDNRKIGTIQWVCNPPWQYKNGILLTPDEINWQTATPDTTNRPLTAMLKNSNATFQTGHGDLSQASFVDGSAAQLAFNGSATGNIVNPQFKSIGKNWLNKSANILVGYIDGTDGTIKSGSGVKIAYAPITAGQTYTVSKSSATSRFIVGFTATVPSVGASVSGITRNDSATVLTASAPSGSNYIAIFYWNTGAGDTGTEPNIQVEVGTVSTTYEAYKSSLLSVTGTIGQNDRFTWDTATGKINGSSVTTTGNLIAYQNGWISVQNSDGTQATVIPISEITYYQGEISATDETRLIQDFTASGHMRFTNVGTLPVKPVITLIGYIPAGLNLTYGNTQWQYNAALPYDSIIIECNAETVTRGSDGENLLPNVDASKDAFFSFSPGQINIDVTASGIGDWPLNLTILVEFVPIVMG